MLETVHAPTHCLKIEVVVSGIMISDALLSVKSQSQSQSSVSVIFEKFH